MKKVMVVFLAVLCLSVFAAYAEEGAEADLPEWTVMFYMCGSDLESRYEYATHNMNEIVHTHARYATEEGKLETLPKKEVQVVLQTGGCRTWHNNENGNHTTDAEIQTDRLQRWSYDPYEPAETALIRLQETGPLKSMADPDTLTDFLNWSESNYPAKKYLLVLWDHGGGSRTGIFVDELFGNDFMYIHELGEALSASNTLLEAVLFDACMMANIETAYTIQESASWMIASEEVVTGEGSNIGFWLKELCNRPEMGGQKIGRIICDSAQEKCADMGDEQGAQLLTWSVIDLEKIEEVADCLEDLFYVLVDGYIKKPELVSRYLKLNNNYEKYGSIEDKMIDLSSLIYEAPVMRSDGTSLRNRLLDAIEDAVVYCVRGSGRAKSRGISFCVPMDMTEDELDIYMQNCPSINYLSLIDAATTWTAPDELYHLVDRLPEISELDAYSIEVEKTVGQDGTPGVTLVSSDLNVSLITCYFYGVNDKTGNIIRLGYVPAKGYPTADGRTQMNIDDLSNWPHVDGEVCCLDMIEYIYGECLYEIPVQIDSEKKVFRCGYTPEKGYEIYGVWAGFDSSTIMFNRNVTSLAKMAGQEYCMLYPVYQPDSGSQSGINERSDPRKLPRALAIKGEPLPPGTYYIQYVAEDMFMRRHPMQEVKVNWDGSRIRLADGTEWEGTVKLQ